MYNHNNIDMKKFLILVVLAFLFAIFVLPNLKYIWGTDINGIAAPFVMIIFFMIGTRFCQKKDK